MGDTGGTKETQRKTVKTRLLMVYFWRYFCRAQMEAFITMFKGFNWDEYNGRLVVPSLELKGNSEMVQKSAFPQRDTLSNNVRILVVGITFLEIPLSENHNVEIHSWHADNSIKTKKYEILWKRKKRLHLRIYSFLKTFA